MRVSGKLVRGLALALAVGTAVPLVLSAQAQTAAQADGVKRVERGTIVTENVPEPDAALAERLRAYLNARSAAVQDWTPDGSGLLVSTRFGETNQLHLVTQPMGARTQLTFAEEPITRGRFRPVEGNGSLLYVWDKGGNENFQLFSLDQASGKTTLLTDGKSRNEDFVWSHKGDRLAFSSTRRDGKNTDIYVATPDSAATAQPILAAEGSYSPEAWSQDDSRLLVGQYVSVTRAYLYVVDTRTGERQRLKPGQDGIYLGGVGFSPDGKGVFLISDEKDDLRRLGLHDLASDKTTWLTADEKWEVEAAELSPDGRTLAYVLNEGGWSTIRLLDAATLKPLPVPAFPKGVLTGLAFSPDGKRLAVSISRPTAPSDAFVADLRTGKVEQWTRSEVGGLNTDGFADARIIEYPTFDQVDGKPRMIPAVAYKPKAPGPQRRPVIILAHGGPEGQTRPGFSSTIQFWANELGAVVIGPNIRGSEGYGKTFISLDNGMKREDSIKDIGALIDWIATQPDLDPKRVAITGGSYGGYVTLASMTHFNDRLAGGSSSVGISNFVTFLESTAPYRRDLRRPEYGDERDPDMRAFLQKISPLTNAKKISKPMLIIQGKNDPRVPVTESEQMVAEIRRNGGDVWYVMATDEGHGFKKKGNQFVAQMAQAMFFRKLFGA